MAALDKYTIPVTADMFQEHAFLDRFPINYSDCELIAKASEEACSNGGFYTIGTMANGSGYLVAAYNREEDIIASFIIKRPVEAEDRKIPALSWLRYQFKTIGHDFKSNNIKQVHKIIENHVRDGGSWEFSKSENGIHFELKIRGYIKGKHSFYREDIFV